LGKGFCLGKEEASVNRKKRENHGSSRRRSMSYKWERKGGGGKGSKGRGVFFLWVFLGFGFFLGNKNPEKKGQNGGGGGEREKGMSTVLAGSGVQVEGGCVPKTAHPKERGLEKEEPWANGKRGRNAERDTFERLGGKLPRFFPNIEGGVTAPPALRLAEKNILVPGGAFFSNDPQTGERRV